MRLWGRSRAPCALLRHGSVGEASVLLAPSLVFPGSLPGGICRRAGVLSHCWKEVCNKTS